ncbi:DDE-type integrase/transposase/recombinase, partial [Candidatus Woesearchaeota archaeon]|nr:DDE-type integrase/transposase/recombinase [Candidatus Woesearchaeota archaeon]
HSSDAHTDETYLRQKGYEIDQFIYYWDTIDYDTKFIIADHISDEKSEADGKILMRKLKNNLKEPPNRIHTDNSYDYPRAIRWTFGYRNVIHIHHPSWKKQFKNNPIERYHNTIRENIKVMRCFYNSTTAYKFLTFLRNYYNFLRPHTTLNGQTPAQAAGFGQWNWWTRIKAIINNTPSNRR